MASPSKKSNTTSSVYLPDEMIEEIITHLPVKIAIRAALVSRRFINSWKSCRNLCFDDNRTFSQILFGLHINRIVHQHAGPKIDKFVLVINPTRQEDRIYSWIKKAVSKGVEELDLNITGGSRAFPITSDLIDVESIRVLRLHYCEPRFPLQLDGLRFLRTLHLEKVFVTFKLMHAVFNSCLVLEDFELVKCHSYYGRLQIFAKHMKHLKSLKVVDFGDIVCLYINAPTLRSLCYSGDLCTIIINCPLLELNVAEFNFGPKETIRKIYRIEELVMSINNCKKLSICSKVLEALSPKFKEFEYTELPVKFLNLKELSLTLGGSSNGGTSHAFIRSTSVNPCDIIYFLKKCPMISTIFIDLGEFPFEEGIYWKGVAKERFEKCCPSFPFLQNLTMRGFKYLDLEFQLLKMIVENAPCLEDVILIRDISRKETLTKGQLLCWMRMQSCTFEVRDEERIKRSRTRSRRTRY